MISIPSLRFGEPIEVRASTDQVFQSLVSTSQGRIPVTITRMTTCIVTCFGLSTLLPAVGLAACLAGAAPAAVREPRRAGCGAFALKPVPVTITWAMAERFGPGYDRNCDGRPDLPNSPEYVNPGKYEVRLTARVDGRAVIPAGMSCEWTIASADQAIRLRASGPKPVVRLPQGTYSVNVSVHLADGRVGSARKTIRVKDILIIALGDSLATGEGNPEEPARWAGLMNFGLLGLCSLSALGSIVLRRAGIHGREPCVVWARRAVFMLLAGAIFECFVGFGWAVRGRLDPVVPACWADGGPSGDQPGVTAAGNLPPANL
jgi:hypothetical protein